MCDRILDVRLKFVTLYVKENIDNCNILSDFFVE